MAGLQYLRARWYDPSSGRFNRLDPYAGNVADPLSLHKYAYTHNNPINGIDPTGLFYSLSSCVQTVGLIATIASLGWNVGRAADLMIKGQYANAFEYLAYAWFDAVTALVGGGLWKAGRAFVAALTATDVLLTISDVYASGKTVLEDIRSKNVSTWTALSTGGALVQVLGILVHLRGPKGKAPNFDNDLPSTTAGKPARSPRGDVDAPDGNDILTPDSRRPVKPGDEGTYGDLKAQKKEFGETEPVDMDHQPSFAAQVKAREQALGRQLSPSELTILKNNTPAVASPRTVHQQTSPTYGGRNNPTRIAEDAADLSTAQARDRAVFDEAMRKR